MTSKQIGSSLMKLNTFFIIIFSVLLIASEKKKESTTAININDLEFIRNNYYASVEKEELVAKLETFIEKKFTRDRSKYPPLVLAYVAALESVKSKHAFWPHEKYNYFQESMKLFSETIQKEPQSLEIRFLRFTILHYIPSFLGYSEERQNDASVILRELKKKDFSSIKPEIQKGIAEFMIRSERISKFEINILKKSFAINE